MTTCPSSWATGTYDIPNQRLLKLKEDTPHHKFNIVQVLRAKNRSPDATYRHPTGKEDKMETASMGVEEDHLSKVFVEEPRIQPDKQTQ